VEGQSMAVMKSMVKELEDRLYPLLTYFSERRDAGHAATLAGIQSDVIDFEERLKSSLTYKDAVTRHKEISETLLKMEEIVDEIEKRKALTSRLTGFLRKTILFFFILTLSGVILLLASQHTSLAGIGLLPIFLDHRGSVLFGTCIVSLLVAAAIECYSFCKKQGISAQCDPKNCQVSPKGT